MLMQTKLGAELEEAQHAFCLQQQTVQETATLLEHCKEGIQRQRVALAGITFVYHIDIFSRHNPELPSSPGLIGSLSLICWVLVKQTQCVYNNITGYTCCRQRICCAGQEDLCHYEDGQFQKLKQAQAQMVASSEVTQANKSIDSVCTKMQECRAR